MSAEPSFEPPGRLNIALALAAYAAAAALLWLGSQGGLALLVAAIGFSFVGNTIFSLLHESVHGVFHRDRRVNEIFGCVSAAFFPTGLTFQRVCHFGHHRRNRTDAELFDYYLPGQNRWVKVYQLYSLLTGLYWTSIPLGCLLYVPFGALLASPRVERLLRPTGVAPMAYDLAGAPPWRTRVEIAFSAAFQAALFFGLGLTLWSWACCYAAFALNWCALQYTDHAWTRRDVREGASNLRVNPLVRWLFLNYHHHLAHHRHPQVPWLYLPRLVDFDAPRPSFLKTYLSLWAGPRPTTEPAPDPESRCPIDPISQDDIELSPRISDTQAERLWREIADERQSGAAATFDSADAAVAQAAPAPRLGDGASCAASKLDA